MSWHFQTIGCISRNSYCLQSLNKCWINLKTGFQILFRILDNVRPNGKISLSRSIRILIKTETKCRNSRNYNRCKIFTNLPMKITWEIIWYPLQRHHIKGVVSHIIGNSTVVSTVCHQQRKPQKSTQLGICEGIHLRLVDSPHNGPAMQKVFPCHDTIMFKFITATDEGL